MPLNVNPVPLSPAETRWRILPQGDRCLIVSFGERIDAAIGRTCLAAARKLRRAVANLARVIACEVVCAARGLQLRAPLAPAAATGAAISALRDAGVGGPGPDRWQAPELAAAERLVASGALLAATEAVTGPLAGAEGD